MKILALVLLVFSLALPTPSTAQSPSSSLAALAGDIHIHDNHLVRYAGTRMGGMSFRFNRREQEASWSTLLYMAQINANLALLDNDDVLLYVAELTLSDADRAEIAAGRRNYAYVFSGLSGARALADFGISEFESRALFANLRQNYLDRMLQRVPTPGLRLLEVTELDVDTYDFAQQNFPLLDINGDDARRGRIGFDFMSGRLDARSFDSARPLPMRVTVEVPELPRAIAVPTAQAEDFANRIVTNYGGTRRVFLAHYATLVGIAQTEGVIEFDLRTDRLAIFGDRNLTRPIMEIDLGAIQQNAEAARLAAAQAEQAAAAEQARIAAAQAAARQQAEQDSLAAARAAVAGIDLAVLGVRLGMTEAEATLALLAEQPAFADALVREAARFGERTDPGTLTVCDSERMRAAREHAQRTGLAPGAVQPGTDVAARQVFDELLAGMSAQCRPEFNLLGLSVTSSAQLADGRMQDSVRIYLPSVGTGDGRVTAVVREIHLSNMAVDMPALLVERFGAPSVTDRAGRTYFWALNGEAVDRARRDREFSDACFVGQSGFPVSRLRLSEYRFRHACGPIMGVRFSDSPRYGQPNVTVYLIDTDQFVAARQGVEDFRAGVRAQPAPPIKF